MTSVTFYCKIGFPIKPNMSASGRRSVEKKGKRCKKLFKYVRQHVIVKIHTQTREETRKLERFPMYSLLAEINKLQT